MLRQIAGNGQISIQNGRQPQWKTTRRQPQWKTASMEDDLEDTLNGKQPQCKTMQDLRLLILQEDNRPVGQPNKRKIAKEGNLKKMYIGR